MLPKAVRAQKHFEVACFIEDGAGERVEEVVALLAEHYGKAAELGGEFGLAAAELAPYRAKALSYLEAAGDAATAFYSNAHAFSTYEAALEQAGEDADAVARLLEKQGDVALRLGRVDAAIEVWERALDHHGAREDLEHVAELHRKIGAGLAHKGERKRAIEHHQRGINLIKDGEPSLALVRLYEEAAWLYMQTGDNMLAIYASEKALRLAERLGEVRAASRAHGIFGRVFGRIGDTAKARENLERAVELARGSDAHETVLALMALGHHLETSDGDYPAAGDHYREALALARQVGDVPAEIELHAAVAQLALYAADWETVVRSSDASAELSEREGLIGKLCLPYALRGRLQWRSGEWQASESSYRRAHELAEQIGWSEVCFDALYGLSNTLRDQGELVGAETALSQALDVCQRAGLIAQSIQANSAQALLHTLAGRHEKASEAAQEAIELSDRVRYPAGEAAAIEAAGIVGPLPGALKNSSAPTKPGRASGAHWRPPAASCCSASDCSRMTAKQPLCRSSGPRTSTTSWESSTWQHAPASWRAQTPPDANGRSPRSPPTSLPRSCALGGDASELVGACAGRRTPRPAFGDAGGHLADLVEGDRVERGDRRVGVDVLAEDDLLVGRVAGDRAGVLEREHPCARRRTRGPARPPPRSGRRCAARRRSRASACRPRRTWPTQGPRRAAGSARRRTCGRAPTTE